MYAFIKGTFIENTPTEVIVEVQGIGYRIMVPTNALSQLPQIGKEIKLFTSLVIREFSQTLYGFIAAQERDLFDVLMNVSGIGPKIALSVIAHLPLPDLQDAIGRNDVVAVSRVPGIGKKTAERLIIEMRDKLPNLFLADPSDYVVNLPVDSHSRMIRDAMSALINMGYTQIKAQRALETTLKNTSEEIDLPSLITLALKHV